jgi:2-hydroxychromene-2-carboxylate isomerase
MVANTHAPVRRLRTGERPMQQIEFYFDPISPFAYLGSVQIERLAARLGRPVEWKPVLIGVTILKVMGLKPLPETPLKGPYLRHDAVRLAEYFDVPFRYHGLAGINSLAALRAFVVLKECDAALAKSLAQNIFSRLWVRGLDITGTDDVAAEAKELGIDVPALLRNIETSHAKDLLKAQVDAAIKAGVFGVPYFVVDGEPIWGVDRMWMVEHWSTRHAWRATN